MPSFPKIPPRSGMTKPITYLHCGKKVPKGFYESGKGIHLGKGIWLLRMRPNPGISTRRALAILNKLK